MAKPRMDLSAFVGKLLEEQDGDVLRANTLTALGCCGFLCLQSAESLLILTVC